MLPSNTNRTSKNGTNHAILAQIEFRKAQAGVLRDLAQCTSVIDVEDPNDDEITYKTIRFEEVNLQIVNGLRATNGYPDDPQSRDEEETEVKGLGNLIVGYNSPDDVCAL